MFEYFPAGSPKFLEMQLLEQQYSAGLQATEQRLAAQYVPLTQEVLQAERRLHIINLKTRLLEKYLHDLTKSVDEFNHEYQEELQSLSEQFVENYKTYIKERKQTLDETTGTVVSITRDNLAEYVARYKAKIEIEIRGQSLLLTERPTQELLEHAQAEERKLEDIHIEVFNRRTELGMEIAKQQETLQKEYLQHILTVIKDYVESIKPKEKRINELKLSISGGHTLLFNACFYHHLDIVRYLLQNGVEQAPSESGGYYPVHAVLMSNGLHTTAILDLLQTYWHGKQSLVALVDMEGFGRTPLHTATLFKNRNGMQWLLEHHANPNAQETTQGTLATPLHNLIEQKRGEQCDRFLINLLLSYGALPTLENKNGETPLCSAVLTGQVDTADIFIQRGQFFTQREEELLQHEAVGTKHPGLKEYILQTTMKRVEYLNSAVRGLLQSSLYLEHVAHGGPRLLTSETFSVSSVPRTTAGVLTSSSPVLFTQPPLTIPVIHETTSFACSNTNISRAPSL